MKRKFLFTAFLAFICINGFSENSYLTDSLKHSLAIAKEDTSRANIMVALCAAYRLSDPDSAFHYGEQAIALSRRIHFSKGEMLALSFESIQFNQMGNLPKALETGIRALQIASDNNLAIETTPALYSIGVCFYTLEDYPKALYYFNRQKAIGEMHADKTGLAYAWLSLGQVYDAMNRDDSASKYYQVAGAQFKKINEVEPFVTQGMGNIAMKKGNLQLALEVYRQSLQISIDHNERRARSETYSKMAAVFKKLNQQDSSIYYAKKGFDEAEQLLQKEIIMHAATQLAGLYETTDPKEAVKYYKIAAAAKDSLYGAGNIHAFETITNQEQERQKEIHAAKTAFQNQLIQYAFIAGLIILTLIAFILYRNNRQKQKANILLHSQKEEIDRQRDKAEKALAELESTQAQLIQSEKMASLGELTAGIAHEIQNPLNFVNNFSDINNELIDELKEELATGNLQLVTEIADDIKQNEAKISHHGKRADAIVKGMLQHSRSSTGVIEPTDINKLADEYLRLSYHGLRAKDKTFNSEIKTDFDETIGKIHIIPQDIGRVLLNLYNNAFYAVNEKKKQLDDAFEPTLSLSTKKVADKVLISIKDNGNGIPQKIVDKIFQPFFTTKPTGEGTGLGLSLSYDIIKAHGGEIKVETKEGEGTSFMIQLPVN